MGCTQSKQNGQEELSQMRELLDLAQNSANEQQNLLRFKIEVLVNMLAMEEKKADSTNKRLETLKWLMHSQGVSEQTLTDILKNSEDIYNERISEGTPQPYKGTRLIDLSGAIARMTEDFQSCRDDILHSFAERDGKIVANLTTEEFSKQLYIVTSIVSKTDIHVLSMRFSDGLGSVSIPEFLEFFTTPAQVRMAKAASAAVRMSLDLLQLDNGDEDNDNEDDVNEGNAEYKEDVASPVTVSSHKTDKLESGVRHLVAIWSIVAEELQKAFTLFEENDQDHIISTDKFKKTLVDICGKKSIILKKAVVAAKEEALSPTVSQSLDRSKAAAAGSPSGESKTSDGKNITGVAEDKNTMSKPPLATSKSVTSLPPSSSSAKLSRQASTTSTTSVERPREPLIQIVPLEEFEVDLLVTRFELTGFVHYGHFMQYFKDLVREVQQHKKKRTRLPADMSGISPFRLSSEWSALRKSASISNGALSPESPVNNTTVSSNSNLTNQPPKLVDPRAPLNMPRVPPSSDQPAGLTSPVPKPVPVTEETKPVSASSVADGKDVAPAAGGGGSQPTKPENSDKKEIGDKSVAPTLAPAVVPPVATVEVVKSSGCCGLSRAPPANAPGEAPASVVAASTDADPKTAGPSDSKGDKLSIETKQDHKGADEMVPSKDTSFNTPKGIASSNKKSVPTVDATPSGPSFRPKIVDNANSKSAGVLRREGLGLHHNRDSNYSDEDLDQSDVFDRKERERGRAQKQPEVVVASVGNSHFHRRPEKGLDQEKRKDPLAEDDDDDEVSEIDRASDEDEMNGRRIINNRQQQQSNIRRK